MDEEAAIGALSGLAQEHRLRVFRLLVREGPGGLPAGQIAAHLGVPASTLSPHLAQLERAGLLRSRREQRRIIYQTDLAGIRRLLAFLIEDCCEGHPEICGYGRADPVPAGLLRRRPMADKVYHVLFLCTGNSARSIMAECALDRWGQGRFKGHSAGSHPKGEVHPITLRLLERLNYRTDGLRSKSWDEFAGDNGPPLDFVFTVCDQAAGELCPAWPGQPMTAHWGVADPAAFVGSEEQTYRVFRTIYGHLDNRIKVFTSLPIRSLDRLSLQKRIDEIGRSRAAATAP